MDISLNSRIDNRDYSDISPSAKSLILLKGITNIPFAKEVAELISYPGAYRSDTGTTDLAFWKRVVHFENRYWNIDQLLQGLAITNVLELSSGYSLRGLDAVRHANLYYIDTDLPEVIDQKSTFIEALSERAADLKGVLKTMSLNALDQSRFEEVVGNFPPGPIIIVNEGLMMYLDNAEKEKLCGIIHRILTQRGGYWITGDIYVKSTLERLDDKAGDSLKELVEQQRIEDNMFESFEVAAGFFSKAGFVVDKEAELDLAKISSLSYLVKNATEPQLKEMQAGKKIHSSWRLKIESKTHA